MTNFSYCSAKDWFTVDISSNPAYLASKNASIWPWRHITETDYLHFANKLSFLVHFRNSIYISETVCYYFGFLGSILILLTVKSKFKSKFPSTFYFILSLVAAISDLIFLALKYARDEVFGVYKSHPGRIDFIFIPEA